MAKPVLIAEIAFASTPDDPSPVWVDVTQWAQVNSGVSPTRGRQDERSQISPSTCTLRLDNADGRFTPEKTGSPYYPNVKKGRRLRVSVTHNAVTYRRFTGYIDEWIIDWPSAKGNQAFVSVTASSRMARLGRGAELRSIVEEVYLEDNPVVYYPFGDAEGTIQAGNVSNTPQPPMTAVHVGSGGGITFGTATGPGTDGLTAAEFTRVDGNNGFYMRSVADERYVKITDTSFLIECFFNTSTVASMAMVSVDTNDAFARMTTLGIDSTGHLQAVLSAVDAAYDAFSSTATVTDGATHHAAIRETTDGSTITTTLYLDGVSVGTSSNAVSWRSRQRLVAGGLGAPLFNGVLSHIAVHSGTTEITTARILEHANAGLNGFSGERSDQRIVRLARYAGVPAAEVAIETGLSTSIVNQITNDQTALSLMQDVAATEGGVLFDARDGTLTFHARSHRYNSASVLTLGTKEIQPSLEPKLDDEGLVNDITASRPNGVSVRAVDTASITEYGVYHETIELLTTSDNEVTDAANWKVGRGSAPQLRIPTAVVDLRRSTTAQATAILAREIGDRITLASLPSQAPATSLDFFIEGYSEQITDSRYTMAFNLSPADLSAVWQLDSSIYSVLGITTRLGY